VLVRCRINRLPYIDRVTGKPIHRYEHPHPGSLTHVEVTKFGNIPDSGGWRFVGKQHGDRNHEATATRTGHRHAHHEPALSTAVLHTAIDDHSHVAHIHIHPDETRRHRHRHQRPATGDHLARKPRCHPQQGVI
jgi:hypothetical protein